jgi:NosR/NirI family nitrous oxide reductase transcriptional regulator
MCIKTKHLSLCISILILFLSFPAVAKPGDVTDIPQQIVEIFPTATRIGPPDINVPVLPVYQLNQLLGYVFETNDFTSFIGFSGDPINILIGLDPKGIMVGLSILEHNEPIFIYGLGAVPLLEFVAQYKNHSIKERYIINSRDRSAPNTTYFDGVTKATVSVLVVNDTIITSALKVARAKLDGFIAPSNMMLKPGYFAKLTFAELVDRELISSWKIDRETLLSDATLPSKVVAAINAVDKYSGQFVELHIAFISVPIIGKNLLGETEFARLQEELKPGEHAIMILSNGDYSYVSDEFIPQTIPSRLSLTQSGLPTDIRDIDFYSYNKPSFITTMPDYRDIHVLRLKSQSGFELSRTMNVGLGINYNASFIDVQQFIFPYSMNLSSDMFILNPDAIEVTSTPLWMRIWQDRIVIIGITCLYLIGLTVLFIKQTSVVKHPRLTHAIRGTALLFVLFFIGFYAQGQLSVVNIFTLLLALYDDFRIEVFLLDPVLFILWMFVFISLFIFGRGLYCGWLCPFGALQEFAGMLAKKLRIKQIKIKPQHHKFGQAIKYVILVALVGTTFVSLNLASKLAEIEPFKTSITLQFVRTWPFVLYAVLLLLLSMKIHKVYCRYLCPLGAGLAIIGRFPILKMLRRRKECGSPCQLCKTKKCEIDAIEKTGEINYSECVQCLECVVTIENPSICVVDKYKGKRKSTQGKRATIYVSNVE